MRLVGVALFLPALGGICQAMPTEHSHSHSHGHGHGHGHGHAWHLHRHDAHNASLLHTDQNNADTGLLARNVKRAQNDNQCGGRYENMLVEAWEDARDAFDKMIERSQSLAAWLDTEDKIPGEDKPKLYSAFLTFEAIFGELDWGKDGAMVVEGQIDIAIKLRTALDASTSTTRPIIELRCDSTWLELIEGTSYRDTRPADRGGDLIRDMSDLGGDCRPADAEEQLAAFWCGDKLYPHNRAEVITFCPEPNKQYTDLRLKAYKDLTYESRESHLGIFKEGSMTFTLIHELSHSYAILGRSQKIDVPLEGGPNGAAYGWGPVTSLAEQTPKSAKAADYPLINADSFAFYVVVMYMENNDWHSGWALDYTDMA